MPKYDPRYFALSGSFQKPTGIDGNGDAPTSSPGSPMSGLPSSLKTRTSMPRPFTCNSPRRTGSIGQPSAKHETMSVPPEMDDRQTSDLMSR